MTTTDMAALLREARDFVGKSRCSIGHSVSEIRDRANPQHFAHCIYCKQQVDLYERLGRAASSAADNTREPQ